LTEAIRVATRETTFVRSLEIQLRVIGALLMREILTRFGRENIGFLWIFVEPMLFTLGVTALWTFTRLGEASSLPIVAFAITGYSPVLLWRNCASRASMAITANTGLLYHRNVRVIDVMIARILIEIAGATMSFVVLMITFALTGAVDWPADFAGILKGWFLLAWFGGGLALIIGAATAYSDVFERLWHTAAYLLFPLSGALFMVDWLPESVQKLALLVPMVTGVELLREGYFGAAVHAHYDIPYMVAICLWQTLFGLALVRDAGRRVEVR
jgi:capsular polysaccharide transport system permease protein